MGQGTEHATSEVPICSCATVADEGGPLHFELAPEAMLLARGTPWTVAQANRACRELFLFDHGMPWPLNLALSDLFADGADGLQQMLEQMEGRDLLLSYKADLRDRFGLTFSALLSVRLITQGDKTQLLASVHDLTEFEQAEARTRFFRSMVESSVDGVVAWSGGDSIVYANAASTTLFALDADRLLGQPIRGLIAEPAAGERFLLEVARRGHWQGELRLRRADNVVFDAYISTWLQPDGIAGLPVAVCFIRDMTERKRADRILEERNRAFRVLCDTAVEIEAALDDGVYAILCRNLRRISNAASAALAAFDPASKTMRLEAVALEGKDETLSGVERPGDTAAVPDELLEALRQTEFRPGTSAGPRLADLFPQSGSGRGAGPEPTECWDVSCIHEHELVAAATIRLHPGQSFRMRDMIHTYLRLAAIIIQRLNAVAALRCSEQKLAGTLHSITDNICMLDDTCTILWANDVALASFGPEVVGRKGCEAFGGQDGDCEKCTARLALDDSGRHEHEVELVLADGRQRTFWCTSNVAARHEDGRPSMLVNVLRDITEMKRMHAELERYSHDLETRVAERTHEVHFLSRIITSTVTAWVVSDIKGHLLRWNPAFENLAGCPLEGLVAMHWDDLTPAEQHEAAHALVEASVAGAGHQVHEQTLRRRDGTRVPVEVRLDTLEVGEAAPVVFRIVTDISARKETEKRLVEARRNAEEASRLKSEFLASISHELRTPLSGILGLANTLMKLRERGEDTQTGNFLARIIKSGRHLQNLITEVLEISRLEAGRLSLNLQAVNPASVLAAAENQFQGVFDEHGLTAEFAVAADTPAVWADKARLTQILVNLLSNALKFTEPGGRVGVAVGPGADASLVEFCVSDTGRGIPNDKLEKIFGHFEQLDRSGSRLGVGLGLAICRRLAEAQHGRIWAESQVGVGSRFHLTLPAAASIANEQTAPQPQEMP